MAGWNGAEVQSSPKNDKKLFDRAESHSKIGKISTKNNKMSSNPD
jgi:hypothetical protein